MTLLADISADARWLLEALLDDAARGTEPAWAALSAFHPLRTGAPAEHPGFGTALLQWQRMSARFGPRASRLAAEAFLALPRTERTSHAAARVLELWVRHVPLPVEVSGRLVALDHLPEVDAALVAEELALGAHENGAPSAGVLRLVADRGGEAFAEARALAQLERFARGEVDAETLAASLAPGLLDGAAPKMPRVTVGLLGGLCHPLTHVPAHTDALDAVLGRVRFAAASCRPEHAGADVARRVVACIPRLTADEVVALSEPERAAEALETVGGPPAAEVSAALAEQSEARAVRVALKFPALAGAAELGKKLVGLTAWRAARSPRAPRAQAHRARAAIDAASLQRWDAIAGGALPDAPAPVPSWRDRLLATLRGDQLLARDELLASASRGEIDLTAVLFDSPGGPGVLGIDGLLHNGVHSWAAPLQLRLTHPVELFDAERAAWQLRLLGSGARAPLNQHFRELHRAGGRELGKKRLVRLRGLALGPQALGSLAGRGWFPTLSPVEISAELELGAWRARLVAEPGAASPVLGGVEFLRDGKAALLSEVPARVLSEAWRDVDEALALAMRERSYVPTAARAELVRLLAPRLGLNELRVESDHVAFRNAERPERITLHNAQPVDGEAISEAEARARGVEVLPFEDDGGVAAVLLGRILLRARPEADAASSDAVPGEGT